MKTPCPTCGGLREENAECPICVKMDEIRLKAIESGLLRGQRQAKQKPAAQPPEGQWWQQ